MDRRTFTKGSALSVLSYAATSIQALQSSPHTAAADSRWIRQLVYLNDQYVAPLLEQQENREQHRWYGAVMDSFGIHNPQNTANFIKTLSCAVVSQDSAYYKQEKLLFPLEKACSYMLKAQHADGTLDLYTTNFHSTPDTAFEVIRLAPVYVLLQRLGWDRLATVQDQLRSFLLQAGEALSVGGIHTPNHRWVVCGALAWLYFLFSKEQYAERIDEWLNEGIDIDAEGHYNEKSTAIYSPLTDRMFIFMARLLNRPALLDPVRKNLDMTLFQLHPNGEVATEVSGRQDQYQIGYTEGYYFPYRYMAAREGNAVYAAACRLIESRFLQRLSGYLHFFLEDSTFTEPLPQPAELPVSYVKSFPLSAMVRVRRNNRDATLLARNPTFFTFYKGEAVLQAVRVAAAFFGKGQFSTEQIEESSQQYVLQHSLQGPYYQLYPSEILPSDGDWNKMHKRNRPKSEIQKLELQVTLAEMDGSWTMTIDIHGTDEVPVALELGFRSGGTLSNVSTVEGIPGAYLLQQGQGQYQVGKDIISFGSGKADHRWTQLRGALPKLDMQSVYITGFTPFKHTIEIT